MIFFFVHFKPSIFSFSRDSIWQSKTSWAPSHTCK